MDDARSVVEVEHICRVKQAEEASPREQTATGNVVSIRLSNGKLEPACELARPMRHAEPVYLTSVPSGRRRQTPSEASFFERGIFHYLSCGRKSPGNVTS